MIKWKQHHKMKMILCSENLDLRIPSPVHCVTLGKSLNFSELPFPVSKMEIIIPTSQDEYGRFDSAY